MAVNLYGNINGTYQRKNIDLFEMAQTQKKQMVPFRDTEAEMETPAVKVNISEEGLRALHDSALKGSVDLDKTMEDICFISEHQPIESFSNRLARTMQNQYLQLADKHPGEGISLQEKADVLLGEFKSICDEIAEGYENGSRVRFVEDATSADGYRRLSKEDELSILSSEFEEFVEKRFGKQHQEESVKIAEIVNNLQKVKQELGRGDIRYYEPEYIPDGFAENLLKAAGEYMSLSR